MLFIGLMLVKQKRKKKRQAQNHTQNLAAITGEHSTNCPESICVQLNILKSIYLIHVHCVFLYTGYSILLTQWIAHISQLSILILKNGISLL